MALTPVQQNAYDYLKSLLHNWGLDALAPDALRLLQEGHSQDNIPSLLQDTDAYRKRFAGNEARRKAGMPVLSPGEYLSVEQSYRQIMQSNGLPAGFYDQPSDFADWIGKDVSPQEVSTRVGYAVDATQRLDAGTKEAFKEYYGVNASQLTAFFLDQNRALPIVQRQARAVVAGGTARQSGLNLDRPLAERIALSSVADQNLASTTQQAVEASRDVGKLSDLYKGDRYGKEDAVEDVFFQGAEAQRKRKRLADQETATFSGQSGVGRSSLAINQGQY